MKFGFPWRVKGIRSEARDTAREAAQRAGMPLNEWLNAVILQQAVEQGIKGPSTGRGEDAAYSGHFSELHQRLDELARRIDQVTRTGPAAYAPKRSREQREEIDQHFDTAHSLAVASTVPSAHFPLGLERAVAEFSARRRALDRELAHPQPQSMPADSAAPAPAHDFSGLEDQLRRITDRIETLQRPGAEVAINALREELGEIGRVLNEAMPRRSLESIEKQILDLSRRIAEGRQAGVDGSALTGIEQSLAEIRDALRGLTPAENLIGYNEAIDALVHRIDLIVADKDPTTMQRLDRSIATLRDMTAHVASSKAISNLAAQLQTLAEKIDNLVVSNTSTTLNKLENRVDELSRTLIERNSDAAPSRFETLIQSLSEKIEQLQQSHGSHLAFGHLEDRMVALVQSLSEKIEPLQQSHGNHVALGHLEDRMVALVERMDASNSRLGHLEAIERGLADLLVQIEDIRADKEIARLRAEEAPGIDVLKQGITHTQDTLEAVRGMLGHVVDRLAVIEKDVRAETQRKLESDVLVLTEPAGNVSASPVAELPETPRRLPATALPQTPAPRLAPVASQLLTAARPPGRTPPAGYAPASPDMAPDQPLEPGSGAPRLGTHPGARIAASEAALGSARPNPGTPGSKSSFIAAARRAAQAAGQDPRGRPPRPASLENGDKGASSRTKAVTRVKSLVLAASIVAIIVGSAQFAANVFDFSIFDSNDTKTVRSATTDPANSDFTAATTETETVAALADEQPEAPGPAISASPPDTNISASLLAPPALPGITATVPKTGGSVATIPAPNLNQAAQGSPALLNPPALNAPPRASASEPKSEVTGSIARTPAEPSASRQQAAPSTQPSAQLPVAIGGLRLRNAALNGDAGAAYQVAVRFAEGRGVSANLEEAANWFERAASKGLTPAQFRYASMLEKGQGVKKDLGAARKLYIAAAAKGHAKAMHNLAVLYAEGADGKPDFTSAAQWFRKAAERGVADSQYNLAVLTARGFGTEKNFAESYKWFALAAAQGDRDAGRKRDEIAAYLDAQTLAAAQQDVKSFAAEPQPAEATVVPEPPGGWDRAITPPARERSRATGPLSISAFHSGKL